KGFAATGVRVGWAKGPASVINKMKSILGHVGAWAPMAKQKVVAIFLSKKKEIENYLLHFKKELEERLRGIHAGFMKLKKEGLPVDCITPEAAIYLTIKIDAVGRKTADGKILETQGDVTA